MANKKQIEEQIVEGILEVLDIKTDTATGISYLHKDGVLKPLSTNQLEYFIISQYQEEGEQYSRSKKNISMDFLKANTNTNFEWFESQIKNTINLKNGVYYFNEIETFYQDENELKSKKTHFKTHPNDYYSFCQIPVNYDETAECPVVDKFISDVFGADKIDLIYEFIGYCLLPHIKYQKALMLVGSGKNGKTTFLEMLIEFLGRDNVAMISLHELDGTFSLINLRYKLANIVSDIPAKDLIDTGNAKRVITDDTLSGSIKNVQGSFNFNNRCKMIQSCNQLPRSRDKTSAFYRRWILLVCDAVFDVNKDVNILEKITNAKELSGLLNRAIEGIKRLEENGGFPDTEQEVKAIWEMESNPVAEFVHYGTIKRRGAEIKSYDMFNAINKYRSEQDQETLDKRSIGYWIRQLGIVGIQKFDDKTGKYYTFYQGLELKDKTIIQDNLTEWVEENGNN